MSILADWQIRERGIVSPFAEQTREVDGEKVVSFGVSSFGYDARLGKSFVMLDDKYGSCLCPKSETFRQSNFYDGASGSEYQSDYVFFIQPNGFLLAHTVEYFKMPRNVSAICLGKSTYARCFSGDTRVALVDGTSSTLEDMCRRSENGERFWGYSVDRNGCMIVSELESPRHIGRDSLVEVVLDNGRAIMATPDHKFMLRNGSWAQAGDLKPGSSLMPLYRSVSRGYEYVYDQISGAPIPTHRMADAWNIRNNVYRDEENTHRHHIDHDKINNNPWNIERMDSGEHIRHHNKEFYGPFFDAKKHGAAVSDAIKKLSQDPSWLSRFAESQRAKSSSFWNEERYEKERMALIEKRRNASDSNRELHRQIMLERYKDDKERFRQGERQRAAWAGDSERKSKQSELLRNLLLRHDITPDKVADALKKSGSIRGAARMLECDRSTFRRFPKEVDEFRKMRNHKVKSVRSIAGEHDVYCLTVPEAGNFALEAGVFVQNCGLFVNCTPLEPEWEGQVTLELYNASPRPIRLWIGEGICQFQFFEGEQPQVSYKDRNGKYQGQTGVTLSRI